MRKGTMKNQQNEFVKMYLTGKYTQAEIAKKVGVSAVTACQWVKQMQPLRYYRIRNNLTKHLEQLTKQPDYANNKELIHDLITEIEQMEKLIIKSKYIPHLTNI